MNTYLTSFFISMLILTISVFSVPGVSFAQEFQIYNADDISVRTIPEIPGPNQSVIVRLESYSFNLNNYLIAWFENGERRSSDFGNFEYTFTTGDSGEVTNLTAVIEVGNNVFRKELRFAPSQIDLLWEVIDGYTPPFYKGKALPIKQSTVKVTAIPETQLIAPSDAPNLVYYWDNNYQRDATKSGFGKQSYTITADPLNNLERISVTANDRRENSYARNTITIPTNVYEPTILFYEIDSRGRTLTHKALNTAPTIKGDTVKLSFHPLHLSSTEENFTDLFVQWSINNEARPPQDFARQNELHISSGGQSGSLPVQVTLEGIQRLLQEHTERLNLVFSTN